MTTREQASARRACHLCALSFFIAVFGARLLAIDRFTSDLPIADQWDAEGAALMIPAARDELGWRDFLAPHNEHRPAVTRALAFLLLRTSGEWNARVQCVFSAAFWAAVATAVYVYGRESFRARWRFAWLAGMLVLSCVPLSWNNLVLGFHSQHILFIATSLVAVSFLPRAAPLRARWWAGAVAMFLALWTIAAGASAALAILFALVFTRHPLASLRTRSVTVLTCLGAIVLGAALFTSVPDHAALRAGTAGDFALTFWKSLGEPVRFFPLFPMLAWLPWTLLAIERWKHGPLDRARDAAFAIGAWVLINLALTAYARGGGAPWPASRYMDVIVVGFWVNAFALLTQLSRTTSFETNSVAARFATTAACAGVLLFAVGFGMRAGAILTGSLPEHRAETRQWEHAVAEYLRTNDPAFLWQGAIPHPSAESLQPILDSPEIRAVLPPSVNPRARDNWLRTSAETLLNLGPFLCVIGISGCLLAESRRIRVATEASLQ